MHNEAQTKLPSIFLGGHVFSHVIFRKVDPSQHSPIETLFDFEIYILFWVLIYHT